MKSTKHEAKKNEILEVAFRIWGDCRYRNTSLSELAAHLQLTKQAIYRYFSSKEKLENEMEKRSISIYTQHAENLFSSLVGLKDEELVKKYVEANLEFFLQNKHYLVFLSHHNRRRKLGAVIPGNHRKKFAELMMHGAQVNAVALRYLDSLIFQHMHRKIENCNIENDTISSLMDIWNGGLLKGSSKKPLDYSRIFNDAAQIDYTVFEADNMVRAVSEAVMEEAGSSVSLGKVAKKAGLTKSSLYNYWPSKEAMLTDVLQKQAKIFSDLFSNFAGKYSDPSEVLFAYLAFTGTFLRRTPLVINYLQRMMSFGVEFPMRGVVLDEEFLAPLRNVIDAGGINSTGLDNEDCLSIINFASLSEIKYHLNENSVRIRIEEGIKELYRLIVGGFNVSRRTM